ncbi:MAG: protein translocase subunit SecD [Rectinemataceae bacterium]|jgi:preprotein translocase subunit SecD
MSKIQRLLIVLVVIAVAFVFLWPTVSWYGLTSKADMALAVGSREQIRDYSRSMAITDLTALKAEAAAGSEVKLDVQKFAVDIQAASNAYRTARKSVPSGWTAKAALAAFVSEKSAYDAVENIYRTRVLGLKAKQKKAVKLGLDLSGGMSAVIQADLDALAKKVGHNLSPAEKADAMKRAIESLNSRIDKFGLTEPTIRQQGDDQIYIEVPGAADPENINSILMGRGKLAFHIVDDAATAKLATYLESNPLGVDEKTMTIADKTIVPAGFVIRKFYKKDSYGLDEFTGRYMVLNEVPGLDGTHIANATTSSDQITGQPETLFQLDKEGGEIFYKMTSAHVKETMAVVLDDKVKAGATISEAIRDSVRMTGFSAEESANLALVLRTAALPVELSPVNTQAVGSSLGEDAVRAGILAVTIAFALVIGFMLLYYKGAGINTAVAEIVNLFIMVGVLSAFGLTLTLPSIAGFVLTIGVSVDANVLIFERIKEELREGKGRISSIRAGFDKAFWTIVDSHLTNLIAALFLAQLGSGPIQGFAISLAIGTICSLFTSLFLSHLIFDFETDVLKVKHVSISWRVK